VLAAAAKADFFVARGACFRRHERRFVVFARVAQQRRLSADDAVGIEVAAAADQALIRRAAVGRARVVPFGDVAAHLTLRARQQLDGRFAMSPELLLRVWVLGRGNLCNQTGLDAAHSGKTLGVVTTVGLVTGALGLGTATYLFLSAPAPTENTRSGAYLVGIRAKW
jgi:hypothetical protein